MPATALTFVIIIQQTMLDFHHDAILKILQKNMCSNNVLNTKPTVVSLKKIGYFPSISFQTNYQLNKRAGFI